MGRDFLLGRLAIRIRMQQLRRLRRTDLGHTSAHHAPLGILDAHQPYKFR